MKQIDEKQIGDDTSVDLYGETSIIGLSVSLSLPPPPSLPLNLMDDSDMLRAKFPPPPPLAQALTFIAPHPLPNIDGSNV
jgi:hypothetical protein